MTLNQEDRNSYIATLRRIADLVEANPELPVPYWGVAVIRCDTLKGMRYAAKTFGGTWKKQASDTTFDLTQDVGYGVRLLLYADRSAVCKRIVTGTRIIPSTVLPAREETILPEREEDIVEWVCPEVLSTEAEP